MIGCLVKSIWIDFSTKMKIQTLNSRGGVEDTRLKAKAKDTKNFEAKDRPSRGQGLGPRTQAQVFSKKKVFKNYFQAKKVFKTFFCRRFPLEESKKRSSQIFCEVSGAFQQNFNGSKNSAVLEPRTGQFSRTWGFEAKDFKICPRGQTSSRTPPLLNLFKKLE